MVKSKEKYLKTKAAAARLQVHPKTLLRWAREGEIPYVRPKGRYYFSLSSIDAFYNNEL